MPEVVRALRIYETVVSARELATQKPAASAWRPFQLPVRCMLGGYRRSESFASVVQISRFLKKRLLANKPTLQALLPRLPPNPNPRSRIQTPFDPLLPLAFSFRTSTPSFAQVAVDALLSFAPWLFLCRRAHLHPQLSPIRSSRGRARSGQVPTLSCPPWIRGPIGLRACGGTGGGRTSLRLQEP